MSSRVNALRLTIILAALTAKAGAACPDLSGHYRLPGAGQCGSRGLPFTLPVAPVDGNGAPLVADGVAAGDGTLEITQSGCESVRLVAKTATAEVTVELTVPSTLGPSTTANNGIRKAQWLQGSWLEAPGLEITHSYRSSHYVGGVFNGPIGPVWKTWILSRKKNGDLSLFSKLDYSSFHRPLSAECRLTPRTSGMARNQP